MEPMNFYLSSEQIKQNAIAYIQNLPVGEGLMLTIAKEKSKRTNKQNAALHDYFDLLAESLNQNDLDQRKVLNAIKEGVDIPWSKEAVKESLWRPMQEAIIGELSTTKLDTKQVNKVYEILNLWTAQTFGVSVEFPSNEQGS